MSWLTRRAERIGDDWEVLVAWVTRAQAERIALPAHDLDFRPVRAERNPDIGHLWARRKQGASQ